ncbi:hypothetical protein Ocin01_15314 [Orchesella cincta]|uniref:Uncharacterized protein n=1 Tax=Orchesella cincta TaxID=48709 RepID=A0A1D2MEH6_ORCCI|nr:hypothetical protein Ocin01_15314 [Orchesella cincta]
MTNLSLNVLCLIAVIWSELFISGIVAEFQPGCKFKNDSLNCGGAPVAQASRWGRKDGDPINVIEVIVIVTLVVVFAAICCSCQYFSCCSSKDCLTACDEYHQKSMLWRKPAEDDTVSIADRTTATATSTRSSDPDPQVSQPDELSATDIPKPRSELRLIFQTVEIPPFVPKNIDSVEVAKAPENKGPRRKFGDCVVEMCAVF